MAGREPGLLKSEQLDIKGRSYNPALICQLPLTKIVQLVRENHLPLSRGAYNDQLLFIT